MYLGRFCACFHARTRGYDCSYTCSALSHVRTSFSIPTHAVRLLTGICTRIMCCCARDLRREQNGRRMPMPPPNLTRRYLLHSNATVIRLLNNHLSLSPYTMGGLPISPPLSCCVLPPVRKGGVAATGGSASKVGSDEEVRCRYVSPESSSQIDTRCGTIRPCRGFPMCTWRADGAVRGVHESDSAQQ